MLYPEIVGSDGGLLKGSPSKLGGTFGVCWLKYLSGNQGERHYIVRSPAGMTPTGVLTPDYGQEGFQVTSNQSELYACYHALLELPNDYAGYFVLDSQVTLERIEKCRKWKHPFGPDNVLPWFWDAFAIEVQCHPHIQYQWVDGDAGKRKTTYENDPFTYCNGTCDRLAKAAGQAWLSWGVDMDGYEEWLEDLE